MANSEAANLNHPTLQEIMRASDEFWKTAEALPPQERTDRYHQFMNQWFATCAELGIPEDEAAKHWF
jgi:hypothetical protein